jgi:hypothetical protein
MRKGYDSLALLAQETLKCNPRTGQLFLLRGRQMLARISIASSLFKCLKN